MENKISLKRIELSDFDDFYSLKCEKNNIFWTGWNNKPNHNDLMSFFNKIIESNKTIKDRKIYLAKLDNETVGYAYIDYVNDSTFHISPGISEKYQGKGYGKKLVRLALNEGLKLGFKNAEAYIREDNIASQKCFLVNGFVRTDTYENKFIPNQNKEIKMIRYLYQGK